MRRRALHLLVRYCTVRRLIATRSTSIPTAAREPIMERRILGRTGVEVAVGLGFAARRGPADRTSHRRRPGAVAGLALGINYFDTAPSYGDGAVRAEPRPGPQDLARPTSSSAPRSASRPETRGPAAERADGVARGEPAAASALERVDLLQLHNRDLRPTASGVGRRDGVLDEVVPALEGTAPPGQDPVLRHHRARRHARRSTRVIDRRACCTPRRSATTCSIRAPASPLPRGLPRHRTSADSSIRRAAAAHGRRSGSAFSPRGALSGVGVRATRSPSRPSIRSPPAPTIAADVRARAAGSSALVREGPCGQPRRGGDPLRASPNQAHDAPCSSATRASTTSSTPPPAAEQGPPAAGAALDRLAALWREKT